MLPVILPAHLGTELPKLAAGWSCGRRWRLAEAKCGYVKDDCVGVTTL